MRESRFRIRLKNLNDKENNLTLFGVLNDSKNGLLQFHIDFSEWEILTIDQLIGFQSLYENDIIEDNNGVGFIEYSEKYAGFRVNYGNGHCKWFYDYLDSEIKYITLLGNKHENPELLVK